MFFSLPFLTAEVFWYQYISYIDLSISFPTLYLCNLEIDKYMYFSFNIYEDVKWTNAETKQHIYIQVRVQYDQLNHTWVLFRDHLISSHVISRRNYFIIEKTPTHPPLVNERDVLWFQSYISYIEVNRTIFKMKVAQNYPPTVRK